MKKKLTRLERFITLYGKSDHSAFFGSHQTASVYNVEQYLDYFKPYILYLKKIFFLVSCFVACFFILSSCSTPQIELSEQLRNYLIVKDGNLSEIRKCELIQENKLIDFFNRKREECGLEYDRKFEDHIHILQNILYEDQTLRTEFINYVNGKNLTKSEVKTLWFSGYNERDLKNFEQLNEYIAEYGWPTVHIRGFSDMIHMSTIIGHMDKENYLSNVFLAYDEALNSNEYWREIESMVYHGYEMTKDINFLAMPFSKSSGIVDDLEYIFYESLYENQMLKCDKLTFYSSSSNYIKRKNDLSILKRRLALVIPNEIFVKLDFDARIIGKSDFLYTFRKK